MENADLLVRINQTFSSFSKGQRLLANYIMENYDKAAFVTASRMGHTVGVSESTVVRFAYALGYDGYPELQRALQELIRNRLTAVQRIQLTSEQMCITDSCGAGRGRSCSAEHRGPQAVGCHSCRIHCMRHGHRAPGLAHPFHSLLVRSPGRGSRPVCSRGIRGGSHGHGHRAPRLTDP